MPRLERPGRRAQGRAHAARLFFRSVQDPISAEPPTQRSAPIIRIALSEASVMQFRNQKIDGVELGGMLKKLQRGAAE
jgi:hypothetical protein